MNSFPNFLIVGSAKCGTSTLASILASHPDCCMGVPKEVNYFQDFLKFEPNPNWDKGEDWYQNAFVHRTNEIMVGEASPGYSDVIRSPKTVKRIYDFNPSMKIIYMVRNPIEKQISTWKMQYRDGLNHGSDFFEFEWALKGFDFWLKKQRENKQWTTCQYYRQINEYHKHFPKSQILITFLEDWKTNQENEIFRIFSFLGLQNNMRADALNIKENTASNRELETAFSKKLKASPLLEPIKRIIPASVKRNFNNFLGKGEIEYPKIPIDAFFEFRQYVKNDTSKFLKINNKNTDFWKEN